MRLSSATILCLTVVACQSGPSSENRLQPHHAPTPFSAAQIHSGCPEGRQVRFLIQSPDNPDLYHSLTFGAGSAIGVRLDAVTEDREGNPLSEVKTSYPEWSELQAHASFPENRTSIATASLTTPAGTFDCWYYTVTRSNQGRSSIEHYWFPKALPGPPQRFVTEVNGEAVYSMTMVDTGVK